MNDALLERLTTEVRHTLHHVLGSFERLSSEPLSRTQVAALCAGRDGIHELLRLVNDTSELADCEAGGGAQDTFEAATMMEEFATIVELRAARKGLVFQWNVSRDVPRFVCAHRRAIEAVLYRLADNSIRYTEQGTIALSAQWNAKGTLIFELRDTGPGIAPDVLQALRGQMAGDRHPGLGFRLVRKQLDAIGADVCDIVSNSSGTTLAIHFPASIPAVRPEATAVADGHGGGVKAMRLLIAEDSDESFAILEHFVKDEGHELVRAMNGAEAVQKFRREKFDMVVMDVNMPVMDGYAATRSIRDWETEQGRSRLPILLLSADSASRQVRIGASVGCSGYLSKPTPKRELISALRAYATRTG